jgi:homoserine dehydrogenase
VLARNQEEIARRAGTAITMKIVADKDLERARAIVGERAIVTADAAEVVGNPDVDIVVELIGGTGVAKDLVLEAIRHGKHVVTANKALLATHGNEIFKAAQKKGVMVAFEASVAGGIPIIANISQCLSANQIQSLHGILNGTSNFILTQMEQNNIFQAMTFQEQDGINAQVAAPATPAAVKGILALRRFTLATPYQYTWSSERRMVATGTLVVLDVDPAYVIPRDTLQPVRIGAGGKS